MAQVVSLEDGYVSVAFSGRVDRASAAGSLEGRTDVLGALARDRKALFDFSAVERFDFDPFQLGEAMRRLAGQGIRLAIASSSPEYFGVGRQIAQFSGVEGAAIAVFRTREEAVEWLSSLVE